LIFCQGGGTEREVGPSRRYKGNRAPILFQMEWEGKRAVVSTPLLPPSIKVTRTKQRTPQPKNKEGRGKRKHAGWALRMLAASSRYLLVTWIFQGVCPSSHAGKGGADVEECQKGDRKSSPPSRISKDGTRDCPHSGLRSNLGSRTSSMLGESHSVVCVGANPALWSVPRPR